MSADKHKSMERRINILRHAVGIRSNIWEHYVPVRDKGWKRLLIPMHYRDEIDSLDALMKKETPDKPISGVIWFHCEGGMAMDNPDIQRLIADGHITVPRKPGSPPKKFTSAFRRFFGPFGISGHAPRTKSYLTHDGLAFLKANDSKFPYPVKRTYRTY